MGSSRPSDLRVAFIVLAPQFGVSVSPTGRTEPVILDHSQSDGMGEFRPVTHAGQYPVHRGLIVRPEPDRHWPAAGTGRVAERGTVGVQFAFAGLGGHQTALDIRSLTALLALRRPP